MGIQFIFHGSATEWQTSVMDQYPAVSSLLRPGGGSTYYDVSEISWAELVLDVTNFNGSPTWSHLDLTTEGAVAFDALRKAPFTATSLMFAGSFPPAATQLLADSVAALPGKAGFIQMRAMGGAAALQLPHTAWPHRNVTVEVQMYADGEGMQGWADQWAAAVAPHTTGQRYFNYIDKTTAGGKNAFDVYFGESASELRRVKATYDPLGLIQGIPGL